MLVRVCPVDGPMKKQKRNKVNQVLVSVKIRSSQFDNKANKILVSVKTSLSQFDIKANKVLA